MHQAKKRECIVQNALPQKYYRYLIDMGKDGGTAGGQIVFTGSPQEMAEHGDTITAEYLQRPL